MKNIAVIGSGYVGSVVAACMATIGHRVVGVEIDDRKLDALQQGKSYFHEPGLDDHLSAGIDSGRLRFISDVDTAMAESEIVFMCVDTPPQKNGHPDLTNVTSAAQAIGGAMHSPHVIVAKSTVPVGTGGWLTSIIENSLPQGVRGDVFSVVSNPEFLREGSAVNDFLYPERIVVGGESQPAIDLVAAAYRPILEQSFPGGSAELEPTLVTTGRSTAEMIKYAANAFLATKISFANEIAELCERVGADVNEVTYALGLDSRISPGFLNAGVGWGGSCFGKDLAALAAMARSYGQEPSILEATQRVNRNQRHRLVHKLQQHIRPLSGSQVALLGIAFKPNTDDIRDSPALTVAAELIRRDAIVRAYDPMVKTVTDLPKLGIAADAYTLVEQADAVVLLTEWDEFLELDFAEIATKMRGDLIIDGRNVLNPSQIEDAGLIYEGMGRHSTLAS